MAELGGPQSQQAHPGAMEARRREISKLHAQGMDKLDDLGIPRLAHNVGTMEQRWLTIEERIELLAAKTARPRSTEAASVLVHVPEGSFVFYMDGMVDPAELERVGITSAVPVTGDPREVIAFAKPEEDEYTIDVGGHVTQLDVRSSFEAAIAAGKKRIVFVNVESESLSDG